MSISHIYIYIWFQGLGDTETISFIVSGTPQEHGAGLLSNWMFYLNINLEKHHILHRRWICQYRFSSLKINAVFLSLQLCKHLLWSCILNDTFSNMFLVEQIPFVSFMCFFPIFLSSVAPLWFWLISLHIVVIFKERVSLEDAASLCSS